jgi:SAM-dependent methyltransferase
MTTGEQAGHWARKASALYDPEYARRYRAHDDEFSASEPCRQFARWLQEICERFVPPIDVLDLGCGTGRYFWALTGVRDLVGIDASAAMIAEARHPYNADRITASSVTLIEDDLFGHEFEGDRFDLIYSIGVLAEHVPLDERVVSTVCRWLRPGGRFAFTTVHPESASIPATLGRTIGRWLMPVSVGPVRRQLHDRLMSGGLYADQSRVRDLMAPAFAIESLTSMQSEAHLHCLCVARKARS